MFLYIHRFGEADILQDAALSCPLLCARWRDGGLDRLDDVMVMIEQGYGQRPVGLRYP